jgi:hypothetical protein
LGYFGAGLEEYLQPEYAGDEQYGAREHGDVGKIENDPYPVALLLRLLYVRRIRHLFL